MRTVTIDLLHPVRHEGRERTSITVHAATVDELRRIEMLFEHFERGFVLSGAITCILCGIDAEFFVKIDDEDLLRIADVVRDYFNSEAFVWTYGNVLAGADAPTIN